ncbi:hypothetical protein Poly24_41020 [Rosistilla carotiformis]|uniref:Uncharacterized protein n=1 Tax=Rosistilla carotiformis TaxID=2528017 RepID=A0A518JXW2_9BACT|nr:hypothetical protein Poly24_41020 [Rosistilla carotiformis]
MCAARQWSAPIRTRSALGCTVGADRKIARERYSFISSTRKLATLCGGVV